MEADSEDGRNLDDVKLIASLKNKIKVLKKAYLEEHDKAALCQQQVESLLPKKKSLEDALAEKESLCARLNKELLTLQEDAIAKQAKGGASPSKGGKGKTVGELEQANELLRKENEELKEQMSMLREGLTGNEKLLTAMKDELATRSQLMNKKLQETADKLDITEKERKELKESCERYEMQSKVNFEQKR